MICIAKHYLRTDITHLFGIQRLYSSFCTHSHKSRSLYFSVRSCKNSSPTQTILHFFFYFEMHYFEVSTSTNLNSCIFTGETSSALIKGSRGSEIIVSKQPKHK